MLNENIEKTKNEISISNVKRPPIIVEYKWETTKRQKKKMERKINSTNKKKRRKTTSQIFRNLFRGEMMNRNQSFNYGIFLYFLRSL